MVYLFIVKDLYTFRILADVRDKGFFDLVTFAAGDAENQVVQRGTAKDVDVVSYYVR
jgi:hypothetical protein